MAALMTHQPILELSKAEASQMAEAIIKVQSFYQLPVNDKTLAWINLASIAGMIYFPRLIMIRAAGNVPPPATAAATEDEIRPRSSVIDFSKDVAM